MINFGRKTVAGVVSAFHKAIDDLKKVEAEHIEEAKRHAKVIEDSQVAHAAATAEANLAREVAGKLSGLVSSGAIPTISTGGAQ